MMRLSRHGLLWFGLASIVLSSSLTGVAADIEISVTGSTNPVVVSLNAPPGTVAPVDPIFSLQAPVTAVSFSGFGGSLTPVIPVDPVDPIGPVTPIAPASPNVISLSEQLVFSPSETTDGDPTTVSPTAGGYLNALDSGGRVTGAISISTQSLPPDTYTLVATTISTGDTTTLGSWKLPILAIPEFIPAGPAIFFDGFPGALPSSFDLFDVASLTIANSSGVVVLACTASPPENGELKATSAVTSGPDAPNAKGSGQLTAIATKGKVKGILSLHVSGAPAKATYVYAINGHDIGSVTTSAKGRLSVYKTTGQKKSPLTDPFGVTSISVHDSSGNIIVSASF